MSRVTKAQEGWREFDALVAASDEANPWVEIAGDPQFKPHYDLLCDLLAVPLRLGLETQSGMPAKAIDVWLSHELRRAGFDRDEVWPRPTDPRVLPREVAKLRGFGGMTKLSGELFERIDSGKVQGGVTGANAKILGKTYEKQVDVVMAQWARGPELMISTKRMDSSFGKNALNRIEESYGDAKNLRGRHPLAATGFLFVMRSTAFEKERDTAYRLMDLLAKLAQEPDAYDATGIVITEWQDTTGQSVSEEVLEGQAIDVEVTIRHDLIPDVLSPALFLTEMVSRVLDRTPINLHVDARRRKGLLAALVEDVDGAIEDPDVAEEG